MWWIKSCLLLLLALLLATDFANAVVGVACTAGSCDAANNEVCDLVVTVRCLCGAGYADNAGSCDPVDCGTAPTLTNGSRTDGGGTVYTDQATFGCNTGYTLVNTTTIQCKSNAQWDALEATCTIVDCNTGPALTNGQISDGGTTTFGSTATYTCNAGYDIIGNANIQCQSDGTWETVGATCSIRGNSVSFCTASDQNGTDFILGTWDAQQDTRWNCQSSIIVTASAVGSAVVVVICIAIIIVVVCYFRRRLIKMQQCVQSNTLSGQYENSVSMHEGVVSRNNQIPQNSQSSMTNSSIGRTDDVTNQQSLSYYYFDDSVVNHSRENIQQLSEYVYTRNDPTPSTSQYDYIDETGKKVKDGVGNYINAVI